MTTSGDVELTILDGGASVVVPSASVQVVFGTSSSGTAGMVVASRNINTLISVFGYGPLLEACALVIARGGTVLAVKTTSNTPGAATAVTFVGTGTSVVTVTGTPVDTYYAKVVVVKGGTIAAAGITFQVSLDAGRTYGPVFALGTATTFTIANTGITLNFAAGTLVVGDVATFATTQPLWNTAGVQAAVNALQASQYALVGWGSMQLVGPVIGADASTINGYLETLATGKIYTRILTCSRDASPVAAYGGTGESEAAWTTALGTSFSAVDAKRVLNTVGYYNMPTQIPNPHAGSPRYRRPLSMSLAARQVSIPPQRHAGRVKDGALLEVVVDPTNDPSDGFVYHDERLNPGFDVLRFTAARTRIKKTGFYIANPKLMSGIGSVFTILPLGQVMDIACGIVTDRGQNDINEDIRLNKSGTIFENEASTLEKRMRQDLLDDMVATNMLSDAAVVVDRDWNVKTSSKVKVSVTIWSRGYILEEDITIGFGTAEQAA